MKITSELYNELSGDLSNELSDNLSDELSNELSDNLSNELSSKIKQSIPQNNNKKKFNISNKELDKLIEFLINHNIIILKEMEKIKDNYDNINFKIYNLELINSQLNKHLNILINIIIIFGGFNLILLFNIYLLY